MRCKCGGRIENLHDRTRCAMCGRSQWKEFHIRPATDADKSIMGAPTGTKNKGKDQIKARI